MSSPSSPTSDSDLVSLLMAMEERLLKAMDERIGRVEERMDRMESDSSSRTSNSRTPDGPRSVSKQEPVTPFIRSHLASVPREVGRRQTILQTDDDGVEYAVRDSAYKRYLPECRSQFSLVGSKISPSNFLDTYREMGKYQEKYKEVLVDFRYAQHSTQQFRAEVCANLRGGFERTPDELFAVSNKVFLESVQMACKVKTIESYYDTLVNDLGKG